MLTQNQIGYLKTISDNKIAHVVPFDPGTQVVAKEIIEGLQTAMPSARICYIGSSKLGIAGENDIDITVLGNDNFERDIAIMEKAYGEPTKKNLQNKYLKWEFEHNGFPVELHLNEVITPNFQEQLDTQEILEKDKDLRLEYEQLKLQCDGLPWKEYLTRKYEFWNKVLGIN